MFGKMMNRFYYGKSGKGDYTKEDLPTTRWQLFWEMLRVRFASLFKLNLLYMIAWIPAIIVIGRGVMLAYSGLANVVEHQAMMIAGEIFGYSVWPQFGHTRARSFLLSSVR